jgi:hypothetical protein
LKIGADNRTKLISALVLAGLAVIVVANALFSNSGSPASANTTQPSAATQPATRIPHRRAATSPAKNARVAVPTLDPTLQLGLLKQSEDTKYAGSGRNIFVAQAEAIPKPVDTVQTDKPQPTPGPQQPAGPPPIMLKFFGFASKPGQPKKVFLSQGEDVFIAGEGDIVDRRYRVLHIGPASVEVEDVLNNNTQSLPLTQG